MLVAAAAPEHRHERGSVDPSRAGGALDEAPGAGGSGRRESMGPVPLGRRASPQNVAWRARRASWSSPAPASCPRPESADRWAALSRKRWGHRSWRPVPPCSRVVVPAPGHLAVAEQGSEPLMVIETSEAGHRRLLGPVLPPRRDLPPGGEPGVDRHDPHLGRTGLCHRNAAGECCHRVEPAMASPSLDHSLAGATDGEGMQPFGPVEADTGRVASWRPEPTGSRAGRRGDGQLMVGLPRRGSEAVGASLRCRPLASVVAAQASARTPGGRSHG